MVKRAVLQIVDFTINDTFNGK